MKNIFKTFLVLISFISAAYGQPIPGTVYAKQSGSWTNACTQSGTWNISNISGTIALPTGAATESTLGNVLTTSDFDTKTGSLTEAAPGTDTASSGLNGRLQRIAQRLTSLIALFPSALTGSGNLKIAVVEDTTSNKSVNVAQMNGTTVTMGNGASGTGVQRVTLASDSTGVLGATQSGTWTVATNADGTVAVGTAPSKSLLAGAIYNSTEISPTTGQAFAVQADSKGRLRNVIMDAAGNTRGANVNASGQLSVSVDSSNVSTNIAQMNGVAVTMGNGASGTGVQRVTLASDSTGQVALAAGSATIGALTANQSVNVAQVAGGTASTVATGVQKVGIADSAGTAFLSAANALNSTGGGVQAAQAVGQFDDVAPTAITENQFGNLRMSTNRNLYQTIRDAAGNERGANVDATNRLSVSVDNSNVSTNIAQMNGVAVTMGNGASGTGVQRVTLANDSTGVVAATQSGNWTSRIVGNGGASLDSVVGAGTAPTNQLVTGMVYNSTEISPTTGQAFAVQADSKGRARNVIMDGAGNTRAANVNASSQLSVSVDNTVTVGSHAVTNAGTFAVQAAGDVASGASDSGSPVKFGGVGRTTLPTVVTDGQRANAIFDAYGRQVMVLGTVRNLIKTQTTTITSTTGENNFITAGAAGIFNDIISLVIANKSATATVVEIRDVSAGTVISTVLSPAGWTLVVWNQPGSPIPQTTAGNHWTAKTLTSVDSVYVTAVYQQNK